MALSLRFAWIDTNNQDQIKWVTSYLIKQGYVSNNTQDFSFTNLEQITKHIDQNFSKERIELLIRKMKTAWSQKKSRSHLRGKKAYSFIMHTNVGDKLKRLSGKSPVNQALEYLINDVYAFRETLKKEHDEQMAKNKLALNSQFTGSKKSAAEISKLKAIKKIEEELIHSLIFQKIKYEMLLKKFHIQDLHLTAEEEQEVNDNLQKSIYYYKNEIRSKLGIEAFSATLVTGDIDILGTGSNKLSQNTSDT